MFTYIIGLYQRAIKNQALTARERAALKAIQGVIIGFVTDIASQLVPILARGGTLNFSRAAIISLVFGFLLGLVKLWASQSDPAVGVVLDAYSKELEQQGIQGLSAQTINGKLHVPAVQLIIPSPTPVTSSGMLPLATSTVQLASEQDIAQHNATLEKQPLTTVSASQLVKEQDRASQFVSHAPWSDAATTPIVPPTPQPLTAQNT